MRNLRLPSARMTDEFAQGRYSDNLASEKIAHERKLFYLDLKENQRGRMFKITEDVAGGKRNTIVVPVEAVREFQASLTRLVEFAEKV